MKNRNRLPYALVLLPTLLLTSCYKDFDKVRVKPFKPDLVVPLAAADNITFADMLVNEVDLHELDRDDPDERIGLKYELITSVRSDTPSFKDGGKLTFSSGDPKKIIESLFPGASEKIESLEEITFEKGAVLKSGTNMRLPLKKGGELVLKAGEEFTVLDVSSVLIESVSEDGTVDVKEGGIRSVKVVRKTFSPIQSQYAVAPRKIGVYKGLLWYSGELTDPQVILKVVRTGWLRNVKINYWFDGCYLEVKDGSGTKEQALRGESKGPLPFNKKGDNFNKGTLDADKDTVETTYRVNASNLGKLSKDWPIGINLGRLCCEVLNSQEFQLDRKGSFGKAESIVTFKLPFTGRFNALIREIKGGDNDGNIELPDVNKLLQDSGGKVNVKSRFTENDTVLLHFYFKNATPMEIYLAAKVGGWNAVQKGAETKKVAEIENVPGSKIGEQTIEGTPYTLANFSFFKAVGGAKVAGTHGIVEKGAVQSNVATIAIPYGQYEKARKSAEGRQLTALLLFRSPNGADGKPIVVSPRLIDYASIRLGVEVKPEVSIELMNKK